MISIENSVIINRPVELVWNFMSQLEENTPKWDRGVLALRITSEGPIGIGSKIEYDRQFFGRMRIGKLDITEWKPLRKVAFKNSLGQITAMQSYSLEPLENGTRLIDTAELEIIGWWKWVAPIMLRMLKRDGVEDISNVKHILENMA